MIESSERFRTTLRDRLGSTEPDRIVFVGVGNRMRGDDAVGPVLLDLLSGHVPHLLDAGVTPEEYTGIIKRLKPEVIIFLDAIDFGAVQGQLRIIEMEQISQYRGSTHKISLDVLMEYLKQETGADVFLIGVQHASISDLAGLSPGMDTAIKACAEVIRSAIKSDPEKNFPD